MVEDDALTLKIKNLAAAWKRDESQRNQESADVRAAMQLMSGVLTAVVRQEPVGHGGFHTGALGVEGPDLRWVYDCGSWHKARTALRGQVDALKARMRGISRFDLLFISHFDTDHVNGLDYLLRSLTPDTVVIPYLEPADAFVVLAGALDQQDRLPDPDPEWEKRWLVELHNIVLRPGDWFGRYGVRRVIRIRPDPGLGPGAGSATGPEGGGPLPIPEVPPMAEDGASEALPIRVIFLQPDGSPLPSVHPGERQVIDVDTGTVAGIATREGCWTDWWFVPYVHRVSQKARERLEAAVQEMLGVASNDPRLSELLVQRLGDRTERRKVRSLYRGEELQDANGISLSLYEGPRNRTDRAILEPGKASLHLPGWLLTGDAKLHNFDRSHEWLKFFKNRVKAEAGWLMLPHHGAAGNFDGSILDVMPIDGPDPQVFVTADFGDQKRPHEDVLAILAARQWAKPLKVSEHEEDILVEVSGLSGLAQRNYSDW